MYKFVCVCVKVKEAKQSNYETWSVNIDIITQSDSRAEYTVTILTIVNLKKQLENGIVRCSMIWDFFLSSLSFLLYQLSSRFQLDGGKRKQYMIIMRQLVDCVVVVGFFSSFCFHFNVWPKKKNFCNTVQVPFFLALNVNKTELR